MRCSATLLSVIAIILLLPAVHSGYPPPPEDPPTYCPPLALVAGEQGSALYMPEDASAWPGAFAIGVDLWYIMNYGESADLGQFYFTQLYQESNEIPGLQRADPICVDDRWETGDSWVW